MSKVSVIIPTYNCVKYVAKAINSVLEQTYKDYEIVIVDDGSSDDTKKVIEPYLIQNNVRYIYQENRGLAAARNTAIRNSKGKYIALLDADDYWSPIKLEKQVSVFEMKPEVEFIHSNMYLFDEHKESRAQKYSMNIDYNKLTPKALFKKILFWEADVFVTTAIIKKTVFDKIGYFDENLSYLGCEDREFWLRLVQKCKTFFLNDYLAYYMVRSNSMTKDKNKMQRAREYVIEKTVKDTEIFKNKKRIKQVIYSNLYFRYGLDYFRARRRNEALRNLLISLKYNIFNLKSYVYIFLLFLPFKFVKFIKNLYNFALT